MAYRRSLDFLPSFFRTDVNSKFLTATLDQMISEPELRRLDGYVGRKFSPAYKPTDGYIEESSALRQNYQLEPSTLYRNDANKIAFISGYQDLLGRIENLGGIIGDQSRLFSSRQYTYDGRFDFDKFANFASYYWLPNGPDAVDIYSVDISTELTFDVSPPRTYQKINGQFEFEAFDQTGFDVSNSSIARLRQDGFTFTGYGTRVNPTIRLARGGTYTFNLDQFGHGFYIQTQPGLAGAEPWQQNLSVREVFGVNNNGISVGKIVFNVPQRDAQDFFIEMDDGSPVDLVAHSYRRSRQLRYVELQNASYSDIVDVHGGIDGERFLDNKKLIFLADATEDALPVAWSAYTDYVEGQLVRYGNDTYRVLQDFTSSRVFNDTNLELYSAKDDWYDPAPFDNDDYAFDSGNFDRGPEVPEEYRVGRFDIRIVDGRIKLTPNITVPFNTKVQVLEGIAYGNRQVYLDSEGHIKVIPNLTANLDRLYYQDGLDPNFGGIIEIVDQEQDGALLVNDSIIGQETYISPNGVTFTNGLKVKFRNNVLPVEYTEKEFYVEGVGNSIELVPVDELVTPEAWLDVQQVTYDTENFDSVAFDAQGNAPIAKDYLTINRASRDRNAWSRGNRWFHQDVILATATYNNYEPVYNYNARAKRPIIEFQPNMQLFNSGRVAKQAINLIDTTTLDAFSSVEGKATSVTEAKVSGYYVDGVPLIPGTRIIFAADRNPDVRNKIYEVSWVKPQSDIDNRTETFFADGSTVAFNLSFVVSDVINLKVLIDGVDANLATYGGDGYVYYLSNGNTTLNFSTDPGKATPPDGAEITVILNYKEQIHLTLVDDSITEGDTLVLTQGETTQGRQYYFSGGEWIQSQPKVSVNQEPLFDLLDANEISYGDATAYPQTTFSGNQIFGYQKSTSSKTDTELGFKLKYKNFNNVGDILFADYINNGSFTHDIAVTTTGEMISTTTSTAGGRLKLNMPDGTYQLLNQWATNTHRTHQYQTQTFFATLYQKNLFLLNLYPKNRTSPLDPSSILVYVNNRAINNAQFDIQVEGTQGYLLFDSDLTPGDKIDVRINTDEYNDNSVFEIPSNLEFNPLNDAIGEFTLGQMRDHISATLEDTPGVVGDFIGNNNSRDLGNYKVYGGKIVQNLGSVHLANLFLNDVQANFVESVLYAQREYARYKNKLLEMLLTLPLVDPSDPVRSLDEAVAEIGYNKSYLFPFYASDMLGHGNDYRSLTYTVIDPDVVTFDMTDVFDATVPSGKSVLVYKNNVQLIKGIEYRFLVDQPIVELILRDDRDYLNPSTLTLAEGDVIEIREYASTDGSHIPQTPTKLGLYPAYVPRIIVDGRDGVTRQMIQGHDGSLTALFGDHRDAALLEFERRIYNNLKVTYNGDLHDLRDYVPGAFRITPYTKSEYDQILSTNFNSWLGQTGLRMDEFTAYDPNDSWTWNYSDATSKVDGKPMPSAYWRGIYKYYFDTDAPNRRPWEMLGFAEEPNWWRYQYGPAPYTRGNAVLWSDLAEGRILEGDRAGIDTRFARPGLLDYIPVDESGNMLSPLECIVANIDTLRTNGTYTFGDGSPVETAWRQSSSYPFAMQIALALMQPAEYFGANLDKNRQVLRMFGNGDQWVYADTLLRKDPNQRVQGETDANGNYVRVNGYTTWISEYAVALGVDVTSAVGDKLRNSTVQLSYKMAGYTDKRYLRVYADQATPNSTNASVMIPDEDMSLVIVKSSPIQSVTYSGVIITKSNNGYTVSGYDDARPYFTIEVSSTTGRQDVIKVGNASAIKYLDGTNRLLQVPYGTEFLNNDQVVDFLISYGRYLTREGFQFTDKLDEDAGFYKDWDLAAREFLFYVQQGWDQNVAISLSPVGSSLRFYSAEGVVDGLTDKVKGTRVLSEDFKIVRSDQYTVDRRGRDFRITLDGPEGIYLLDLDVVNYEHVMVLENRTRFADIIYDPAIGVRQYRVKLKGYKTGDWDGSFGAAGFIINDDNIPEWQEGKNYYKGDIVLFKNAYYTAAENIAGATDFDQEMWIKADYDKINKGLLPNLSNKSGAFKQFYDIDSVNLENDADRLGKGLIGLRPRSYLENLQISDTSQAKFYQGLITQKGSRNSLDKLLRAKLDNFDGSINFYEEWAIRLGQYGATDSRQQIQLILDEGKSARNPTVIELLPEGGTATEGRIGYLPSDLYNRPRIYNNEFLRTRSKSHLPSDLYSSGYARLEDVNWWSETISTLNTSIDVTQVDRGHLVFIAADLNNQWNIRRVSETRIRIVQIAVSANGVMQVDFDRAHELSSDDIIFLQIFQNQPNVSGFYRVVATPVSNRVTVNTNYSPISATKVNGFLFNMISVRFAGSETVGINEPLSGWREKDKLFIDSATSNGWGVYEKRIAYNAIDSLTASTPVVGGEFGSAVGIDSDNRYMIVGQPGDESVICITDLSATSPVEQKIDLPSAVTGGKFGKVLAVSDTGYAVVSSPDSENIGYVYVLKADEDLNFSVIQAIASPSLDVGGKFGNDVAISKDGKWAAIGQPGVDGGYVYVYQLRGQVVAPPFTQTFFGDGFSDTFTLSGAAANPENILALTVVIDGRTLSPYTDYTLSGNDVIMVQIPVQNAQIDITVTRLAPSQTFTGDGGTTNFALTGDSSSPTSVYNLRVLVNGVLKIPFRDYNLISSNVVAFVSPPAYGATIDVYQNDCFELVGSAFTADDNINGDEFGTNIDLSSDGRRIVVGAPAATVSGKPNAGKAYVFERTAIELIADGATTIFTADVQSPATQVFVNGILATANEGYGGDYTLSGSDVVFLRPPTAGSVILIENNYLFLTSIINQPAVVEANAEFGTSVLICPTNCSVYVGSPYSDGPNDKQDVGKVYRFVNQGRFYGSIVGSVQNPTLSVTGYLILNDVWVSLSSGDALSDVIATINGENIPGVVASNAGGYLRLESDFLIQADKLKIAASDINILTQLGLEVFYLQQTITAPSNEEFGKFGKSLGITGDALTLLVGSDDLTSIIETKFDDGDTTFDGTSTAFFYMPKQSGAVLAYQYLSRTDDSLLTPGQFIPAQRLTSGDIDSLDKFGASIAISKDAIIVGAPGDDTGGSNAGAIIPFYLNANDGQVWKLIHEESAKVDVDLINRVSLIDTANNVIVADLDYIDPYKGKISGLADQEISYKFAYDPAVYNTSNSQYAMPTGVTWGREHIGEIWWDIGQSRWVEYEQGDVEFKVANWGTAFPGSVVVCYEWTESLVPPEQYSDANNPTAFVRSGDHSRIEYIDDMGMTQVRYYFWVGGKTAVPDVPFRTKSAAEVEFLIANPKAAGVPFVAFVAPNALAIYNAKNYIRGKDTVLSIDYDAKANEDNIHGEYQLIGQDDANSLPDDDIITKLIDSLAGQDADGRAVPDPTLGAGLRYGKEFRPRQTMFRDRAEALRVAVDYINVIMSQYSLALDRNIDRLLAGEPQPSPTSGEWNDKVADLTELEYINTLVLDFGYRILVEIDSSAGNRWRIYELSAANNGTTRYWQVYRTQAYANYNYVFAANWTAPDEIIPVITDYVIDYNYELGRLSPTAGQTVKIKDDGRGLYSIAKYDATNGWQIIMRENGTYRISDALYKSSLSVSKPETQLILRAVYEDIFILDSEIEKNRWFFIMMQHLLQEQKYVDWIFKSSFIKVEQRQRAISQIPTYQRDNQDLVRQYIEETKPYHTKIREFVLRYDGLDESYSDTTDFDVPAYYIEETGRYRAPNGSETIDDFILDLYPYVAWRDNHTFAIGSIEVISGGSGFITAPELKIIGGGGSGATAKATIANGSIIRVEITNPGSGYTTTPTITLSSSPGTGAILAPRLVNNKIRKIDQTIKFDRTSSSTSGLLVHFKDSSGNPVDIRNERLSRIASLSGVIDYLLDIISGSHHLGGATAWAAETTYYAGDIVLAPDGFLYEATTEMTTGLSFTNDYFTRWFGNWVKDYPTWQPFTAYNSGDVVYLNGKLYQAIQPITGTSGSFDEIYYNQYSIPYPAANVPIYRMFPDNSGRIQIFYQRPINGLNEVTLQFLLQNLDGGINSLDISGTEVTVDDGIVGFNSRLLEWQPNSRYNAGDIISHGIRAYKAMNTIITGDGFEADPVAIPVDITSDEYFLQHDSAAGWQSYTQYYEGGYFTDPTYPELLYKVAKDFTSGLEFSLDGLVIMRGEDFDNHLDRTWAYYQPRAGQLGRDLGQLFSGVTYPGVKVKGASFSSDPGFDVSAYDMEAYDQYVIGVEGVPVLDPAVLDQTLISSFTDTALGTRPEDIIVYGSGFVDTYSSHAPEEMMPGRVYDALNMRVYTRPNDDWTNEGLGLDIVLTTVDVPASNRTFSFTPPNGMTDHIWAFTKATGRLIENIDFIADRANSTITVTKSIVQGDTVLIYAIDEGGPGMLFSEKYVSDGSTIAFSIPIDKELITQSYVLIDGIKTNNFLLSGVEGTGYSTMILDYAAAPGALIAVHVFGTEGDKQALTEVRNTRRTIAGSSYPGDYTITLDEPMGYDEMIANRIIVELNGSRLQPPNQAYYMGDGSTSTFMLPDTVYVNPDDVTPDEVKVSVNGVRLYESVDWELAASDGSSIRMVTLNQAPIEGAEIEISFTGYSPYGIVDANTILIDQNVALNAGDVVDIITFTNHDPLKIRTQNFKGTTVSSITITIGFDDVPFDSVALDANSSVSSTVTQYELSRPVNKTNYLWVTLDIDGDGFGSHIYPGIQYRMISPTTLELGSGLGVNPNSVLTVTSLYEVAQKPSIAFRIFNDMNGNVEYRRIAQRYSTELAQDLMPTDLLIHVADASKLGEPNKEKNIPGVVYIGSERITYFARDTINNTLGQLRRGTSGTSILEHAAGAMVEAGGLGQEIPDANDRIWYNQGVTTASDGMGLQNSQSAQAKFLLDAPAELPLTTI